MIITPIEPQIAIPESAHWYASDGVPVEVVPRKTPVKEQPCPTCMKLIKTSNKGKAKCKNCNKETDTSEWPWINTKAVTMREARTYGLFPSVSKIKGWSPTSINLRNWERNLIADAVIECFDPNIPKTEWKKRSIGLATTSMELAATRGTEMHKHIQKRLEGEEQQMDWSSEKACNEIEIWDAKMASLYGGVRQTERSFTDVTNGCGGTIDYVLDSPNVRVIADYKTKSAHATYEGLKKANKPYPEDIIQLAGYWALTGLKPVKGYIILVSQMTGDTHPIEIAEADMLWGWDCFKANLFAWKTFNKHWPEELYEAGKSKSSIQIQEMIDART